MGIATSSGKGKPVMQRKAIALRLKIKEQEHQLEQKLDQMQSRAGGGLALSASIQKSEGQLSDGDIMAMALLAMTQSAKSAREDLKAIMDGVRSVSEQKAELRRVLGNKRDDSALAIDPDLLLRLVATAQVDDIALAVSDDLSDMQSLRLQMHMDRVAKMMAMLSNLMKKLADTQQTLVDNIK